MRARTDAGTAVQGLTGAMVDIDGNGRFGAHPAPLAVVGNLARYDRKHEKYYSEPPMADVIALQRSAQTLIAVAEPWTTAAADLSATLVHERRWRVFAQRVELITQDRS
jgi:hypothetical protein